MDGIQLFDLGRRFGQMVFDPVLPPLRWQDLDGDMVVFARAGLLLRRQRTFGTAEGDTRTSFEPHSKVTI